MIVYSLLSLLVLAVILGFVLSSGGEDPAPSPGDEDRSVTAGVQCEEAVNKDFPGAEPETTRAERDGANYTVGGFVADGRAYVCKITDEGGGRWTVTDLTLG